MSLIHRLSTAIRQSEQFPPDAPPRDQASAGGEHHTYVEITSTTQTSGRYPGNLRTYDADAKTWSDVADSTCWVVDANSVGLVTGKQYEARLWDYVSGVPVFIVEDEVNDVATAAAPDTAHLIFWTASWKLNRQFPTVSADSFSISSTHAYYRGQLTSATAPTGVETSWALPATSYAYLDVGTNTPVIHGIQNYGTGRVQMQQWRLGSGGSVTFKHNSGSATGIRLWCSTEADIVLSDAGHTHLVRITRLNTPGGGVDYYLVEPPGTGAGGSGGGMEIGDTVTSANVQSVLFVDASGDLAEDPGWFEYDPGASPGDGILTVPNVLTLTVETDQILIDSDGLFIKDADASHTLNVILGSNLTAHRELTLLTGDADRTLTLGGNATLNGGTHSGTNTGDQTITLTGNVTGSGTGSFATTIANDSVTNARLADMAQATFKMRASGAGTGDPIDGTASQARTALGLATTDTPQLAGLGINTSGSSGTIQITGSAVPYTAGFRHAADTLDFRFLAESATIGEGAAGSWSGNRFSIFTDSGRRVTVHENNASGNPGNVTIGTASNPTGPTPCLLMAQAAGNITGIPSNSAGLVALDVAGTCELYAFDEAGNHVQQTRHAKDAPASLYEIAPGLDEISRTVNPYPIDGALWGRPGEVLNGIVYWVSQMRGEHSVAKPKWMVETFDEYAARMGYSQAERERRGLVVRTWADDQEAKRVHRENERAEWVHDSQNWMREEIEKELLPETEKFRRGIPRDYRRRPFPKQRPEPYTKKAKPPWEQ